MMIREDSDKKAKSESLLHKHVIVSVPKFKNAILIYIELSDFNFDLENGFKMVDLAKGEVFTQIGALLKIRSKPI